MARTPTGLRRDSALLYWAIFLISAPMGMIVLMARRDDLGSVIVGGAFGGVISTGWAYTFIRERWWLLAPLIVLPFVAPQTIFQWLGLAGVFDIAKGISPETRITSIVATCIASTTLGFILFMIHMRRNERHSARAHAELDVARRVHDTLVPSITLSTPLAEVYGRSSPSSAMGGDLIDVIAGDGRLDVVIGDVSGHGVGAGIVMAMLKGCIRTRLMRHPALDEVLADTNRVLADLTAPGMFATCAALRLLPGRRLEFALAGHLPILHYRAAEQRWDRHPNESLPLGIEQYERYVSGAASVGPGDILAVFTDGLMEAQDGRGRELGLEGFARILASAPTQSLESMHETVMKAVASHGAALDDQSLVLVRVS